MNIKSFLTYIINSIHLSTFTTNPKNLVNLQDLQGLRGNDYARTKV